MTSREALLVALEIAFDAGLASMLGPMLLSQPLEAWQRGFKCSLSQGVWHTGIVVYGKEQNRSEIRLF